MNNTTNECTAGWNSLASNRCWLAVVCLMLAVVVPRSAFSQAPVKPADSIERHVPADAVLAIAVDDAAASAKQFQATPLGEMFRSPSWKPYYAALAESHTPSAMYLRPWFGIDWPDLAEFPVPACICTFADSKGKPATALIVNADSQPAAAKSLADRAKAYFHERRKAKVREEKAAEVVRTIYSVPAAGAAAATDRICLQQGNLLAFVTSRDGADRLESLWKTQKEARLSDLATWQQVDKEAGTLFAAPHDVRWWVRPLELIKTLPPPPADGKRGRRDWRVTAERLGIGGVRAAGGTIRLARSKSASIEMTMAVVAPRPFEKALQLASLKPGEWRDPPAWAADSTAVWTMAHRDVKLWFEGLGAAVDEKVDPGSPGAFRDILDDLRENPDGPKINVRREIVPRLLPPMAHVTDFGGAKTEWNPSGRRDLFILDAKETADLEKVFRRQFAVDVADKKSRLEVVAGHTVWSRAPGRNLFFDFGGKPEQTITSLAIVDGAVLLSTEESWLRSVLEEKLPALPLSKDQRFAARAEYLKTLETKETAVRSLTRAAPLWQMPYENLKAGKTADNGRTQQAMLSLFLFGATEGTPPKLTSALPEWKNVSHALGTLAVSVRVTPGGFAGVLGQLPDAPAPDANAKAR